MKFSTSSLKLVQGDTPKNTSRDCDESRNNNNNNNNNNDNDNDNDNNKDSVNSTCKLIDMTVPSDRNIALKEIEKKSKYKDLELEIQ